MTDLDLQNEIDRSFGTGPEHRPLEQRLTAGRHVVRRRRLAAAGVTLAVVVLAGTAYAAVQGPGSGAGTDQVAVDPPSAEPTADPSWEDSTPVRYRRGELEVRPGVVVHQRIEDPYDLEPPLRSDAFDLTFDGRRQWVILVGDRDGQGYQAVLPSEEWKDLEAFVASQANVYEAPELDLLVLGPDGRVVAAPGARVLQRSDDPQLGEAWSRPASATGAALVQPLGDDPAVFYAWRIVGGDLQLFPVPPEEVVGATWPELLSYARMRLSEGEGR